MKTMVDLQSILDDMRAALTSAGYSDSVSVNVDVQGWRHDDGGQLRYVTQLQLWVSAPVNQFFPHLAALRAWLGQTTPAEIPVVLTVGEMAQ